MSDSRPDPGAPIIVSTYDLCAELYVHVNRFPRAQRTLLGRMILDEALRMLAALTVANRLADRRGSLAEASGHLDALRIALRLAKRLAFLPNRGYVGLSGSIDEVGRMLGGWLKHERARGVAVAGRPNGESEVGAQAPGVSDAEAKRPTRRKGGVRFTMRSPLIERYLAAKLDHPGRSCWSPPGRSARRSSRTPSSWVRSSD
ncbi:MAG: four helix bundle protein [Longimicrobiales bacterium]